MSDGTFTWGNGGDFQMVELTCKARIGSEWITVREVVLDVVYNDPEARKLVESALREKLMRVIADRWKPKITVRR